MKKEMLILCIGGMFLSTNIYNLSLLNEESHIINSKSIFNEFKYDNKAQTTRVGFYQKNYIKRNPLLNQNVDLSSGLQKKNKDLPDLSNSNNSRTFLGSLYNSMTGTLIFGRKLDL